MKRCNVRFSLFWLVLAVLLAFTIPLNGCGESSTDVSGPSNPEKIVCTDDPNVEMTVIAESQSTDYYIIRSDMAGQDDVNSAVKLRKALNEISGAEFGISTDWEKNPVYEHEIIVGNTLRDCDPPIDRISLGRTGYIIKEENGKIFIAGGTGEGTSSAVSFFISEFVKGERIEIPVGYEHVVLHQYPIPEFYIDMSRISNNRTILVPENPSRKLTQSVEKLRDKFYERTGLMLNITNRLSDGTPAFVISSDKPAFASVHEIVVSNRQLVFTSSAKSGVEACVDLFVKTYLDKINGSINFPSDFHYLDLGDHIAVSYPEG